MASAAATTMDLRIGSSQMPVQLGRERAAGERVEEKIALVGDVLDTHCNVSLGRDSIDRPNVGNEIAFEALIGVSYDIAVVDRSEHAARIARGGGEREAV